MSRENVELVRRAYECFDVDLDGLLALLDPEIEWVSSSDAIEPGTRHGHAGVLDAFDATSMAWQSTSHTPHEIRDAGSGRVLATVIFHGRGRGSGMEAERTEYHVWGARAGKIVRFEWFYGRSKALAAAGLT